MALLDAPALLFSVLVKLFLENPTCVSKLGFEQFSQFSPQGGCCGVIERQTFKNWILASFLYVTVFLSHPKNFFEKSQKYANSLGQLMRIMGWLNAEFHKTPACATSQKIQIMLHGFGEIWKKLQ